jgi:hypothetical protein
LSQSAGAGNSSFAFLFFDADPDCVSWTLRLALPAGTPVIAWLSRSYYDARMSSTMSPPLALIFAAAHLDGRAPRYAHGTARPV